MPLKKIPMDAIIKCTTNIKCATNEDLKKFDVPTLILHGDDDQIVPIADSALLSVKLLKRGTLKVYKNFPHGMCTTHADTVNPDLLAFVETPAKAAAA